MFFGARSVVRAKQNAAQRELILVILGRNRERRAILFAGLRKFPCAFECISDQIPRTAFRGLQVSRTTKCFRSSRWIGFHQHEAEVQMSRSHFRIERDGAGEFSLCFLPTLESGACITALELCEAIIGP